MTVQYISLFNIENVDLKVLSKNRLNTLMNGFLPFDTLFKNNIMHSDPIVIDISKKPYSIINGRHRIYIAREKKIDLVKCFIQ